MRPQGTPFWVLNGGTARHEINAKEYRKSLGASWSKKPRVTSNENSRIFCFWKDH